jgi:hypothetical protein
MKAVLIFVPYISSDLFTNLCIIKDLLIHFLSVPRHSEEKDLTSLDSPVNCNATRWRYEIKEYSTTVFRYICCCCCCCYYYYYYYVKVKLSLGITKYHATEIYPVLNKAPRQENVWGVEV